LFHPATFARPRERSRSKEKLKNRPDESKNVNEKEMIKVIFVQEAQYFGDHNDSKKKRQRAMGEKHRNDLKFEWDNKEDTSRDSNPLYDTKKDYVPLFGRGIIGGVDVGLQEKAGQQYSKLVHNFAATGQEPGDKPAPHTIVNRYSKIDVAKQTAYKRPEDMSERDWKIFRENHDIRLIYGKAPPPMREFGEGELNVRIVRNIESIGYKEPTPIQMQAIPMGLARKDMIGLAPTGSGKSAAFLIPAIHHLIPLGRLTRESPDEGPNAIVLSPTRELTLQIQAEFERLAAGLGLRSAVLIGGHDADDQEDLLTMGVDLVFGTPGRVFDLLQKSVLVLERCHYVVVDEADLMVDLGQATELHEILSTIPRTNLKSTIPELAAQQEIQAAKRQAPFRTTHMFSATMPRQLRTMAQKYLRCECFVSIGEVGEGNKNIRHELVLTGDQSRKTQLLRWLENCAEQSLVFCKSQDDVEAVGKFVQAERYSVSLYHGGKSQTERETTIERFKQSNLFLTRSIQSPYRH
jgi:ATP-dependent RNA helicase DDX23/PRP28